MFNLLEVNLNIVEFMSRKIKAKIQSRCTSKLFFKAYQKLIDENRGWLSMLYS